MRKLITLVIALMTLSIVGNAQGINFRSNNFDEILKIAKSENKLIFIDFYTTWCGPCKGMDAGTFKNREVGDFYNKNFINLKLDAEAEGVVAAKKYGVKAFPTLLFINGDGKVLSFQEGGANPANFIELGKKALKSVNDPDSYINLTKRYDESKNDEEFLLKYIDARFVNNESIYADVENYLKIQKSFKQNGVDIFEFFLKYNKGFALGGEAEVIIDKYYDDFFARATRREERSFKNMHESMLYNTRKLALSEVSVELYETFLNSWKSLPNSKRKGIETEFELELLNLKKDGKAYKKLASEYITTQFLSKTEAEVKLADKENHKKVKEFHKGKSGMLVDGMIKRSENAIAAKYVSTITKIGRVYLSMAKKKKDYKTILDWTSYGERINSSDIGVRDLQALTLYRMGKKSEGLAKRKEILASLEPNSRSVKSFERAIKIWEEEINNK